jgi:hypothetical protein
LNNGQVSGDDFDENRVMQQHAQVNDSNSSAHANDVGGAAAVDALKSMFGSGGGQQQQQQQGGGDMQSKVSIVCATCIGPICLSICTHSSSRWPWLRPARCVPKLAALVSLCSHPPQMFEQKQSEGNVSGGNKQDAMNRCAARGVPCVRHADASRSAGEMVMKCVARRTMLGRRAALTPVPQDDDEAADGRHDGRRQLRRPRPGASQRSPASICC